jgi:hypothetical protein
MSRRSVTKGNHTRNRSTTVDTVGAIAEQPLLAPAAPVVPSPVGKRSNRNSILLPGATGHHGSSSALIASPKHRRAAMGGFDELTATVRETTMESKQISSALLLSSQNVGKSSDSLEKKNKRRTRSMSLTSLLQAQERISEIESHLRKKLFF